MSKSHLVLSQLANTKCNLTLFEEEEERKDQLKDFDIVKAR